MGENLEERCIWKEISEANISKFNKLQAEGKFSEYDPRNIMKGCQPCDGYSKTCSFKDFQSRYPTYRH